MISVIVSSYNDKQFKGLEVSVKKTIGVPFEIIRIENPRLMGLCQAYNSGATRAKYHILCFVHDDVIFKSTNWGINLLNHFQHNDKIGLIGIAGASYKPYCPSGWSFPQESKFVYMHVRQPNGELDQTGNKVYLETRTQNPLNYVATIDGCFMATKKNIWKMIKFDENLFNGYHCYDIDFSLAIGKQYLIATVNNIDLTHLSSGGFDSSWVEETLKLHQKWNDYLPKISEPISKSERQLQEYGAFSFLLRKFVELNYSKKRLFLILLSTKMVALLGFKNWMYLNIKTIYIYLQTLPIFSDFNNNKNL